MSNAVKKITAIRIKKYLKKFQYFLEVQSILFDLFLCLAEALIGAIKKNNIKEMTIIRKKKIKFKSTKELKV